MSEKNVILISKDYIDSNFITSSDERVVVDKTETGYDLALNGSFIERDEYTTLENKVDGNTTSITALEQDVAKKQDDVGFYIDNGIVAIDKSINQYGFTCENHLEGFTRFDGVEIQGKKPVLDITSSDKSVTVTRDAEGYSVDLKANGGSSTNWQPCDQVIYDIIPCNSSFSSLCTIGGKPSPYPIDLEINVNQKFPIKGFIELTHIIVPRLQIDRSGYYIGYSTKGTNYKQDHKLKDFWAVTSNPCNIENDGESTYIYNVECKKGQEFIGAYGCVDPNYGWSGWLNSSKPNFSARIAYYSKSTDENGEDIYVYEADVPAYSAMPSEEPFPLFVGDSSQAWSNNPNFDPASEYMRYDY